MVKMVGITTKPKEKKTVISYDEAKHVGTEPKWDLERAKKFDKETFDHHLRESLRYYNYFYSSKDMKKHVVAWVQKNMKLTKEQLSFYVMSDPEWTPMTVCSLVKAEMVGMPMRENDKAYLVAKINRAIRETANLPTVIEKVAKKEAGYAPTIQDRLNEKTAEIVGEIEGEVDNAFRNKPTKNIYEYITDKNLAQAQVGKVRAHFQDQINEISLYVEATKKRANRTDEEEQLIEGFRFLNNADIKRIGAFYVKLLADLESYTHVKKAAKRAAKKPRAFNKEKAASKAKYMKESKELKVVSVTPVHVMGAQACWVYNVKSRKIGKYVAEDHSALGIKGTSITGFDANKSVQKTIRKPETQIQEFMKMAKVPLRTYMKDIKAVEIKLNGRLSEDVLILKVE